MSYTDVDCPDCGHTKIQHPLALGFCAVCHQLESLWLMGAEVSFSGKVCRRGFAGLFSQGEIEKLARVPRNSFKQWDVCAVCEAYWCEHMGALCPSGMSTFKPMVGNV
jgi:hypothetical protein